MTGASTFPEDGETDPQLAAELDALRVKYNMPAPAPQTFDEAVERTMMLMDPAARDASVEAIEQARGSAAETRGEYAGIADAAMESIYGSRDAQKLLQALRDGCAPSGLLLDALDRVLATSDRGRLQAFARELQKALERR